MRRSGSVLTGVDRVELAYAGALIADPVPVFGLIRSRIGYILLDQVGMERMLPFLSGERTSDPDETEPTSIWRRARRCCLTRVPPFLLSAMVRRRLPAGFAYINVGHSNLTRRVLSVMRARGARIAVLIHDVIPLEFPEFQRDGTVRRFARMIARVGRYADLIIYNSHDTHTRAQAFLPQKTAFIVSHLGTDHVRAAPEEIPVHVPRKVPFFVSIGTIEPRKNHALLLDIWADMGAEAPGLIIAGGRGWKNETVFDRLDALPADGPVCEVAGLTDGALAALVEQSSGVLFPSHAEGFGLPATEAAARGVPIVVNDLPVLREILGDIPIYASVSDRYLWARKITELATAGPDTARQQPFVPPDWDTHFKTVLRLT